MEASELRVGNFVDIIDRTREVHLPIGAVVRVLTVGWGSDVEFCFLDEIAARIPEWQKEPLRNLCGIPLTEEWMLRFGFEHIEYRDKWQHSKFPFQIENDGKFFLTFCYSSISAPHIKYVHQLQNLYFALTGEELSISITDISKQSRTV